MIVGVLIPNFYEPPPPPLRNMKILLMTTVLNQLLFNQKEKNLIVKQISLSLEKSVL